MRPEASAPGHSVVPLCRIGYSKRSMNYYYYVPEAVHCLTTPTQ